MNLVSYDADLSSAKLSWSFYFNLWVETMLCDLFSQKKSFFQSFVSCFSMLCGSYLGCSLQSALELINIWDTFQSNVFTCIVFFVLECNLKTKGRFMNFTTYNHNDSTKTWNWSPGHRKPIVWSKPTEQKNLNWLIGSVENRLKNLFNW